ncbi:ATP-binding protein [Streptosporangium sp. NBC_01810]|uniref:ATP-binding protein n=1 Tax=Streptosporangium sp. NBC_01810 TaxID=2975951 RepID=UPI002DD7AF54|nr:ATP-binding protein [Streptosporangium sp. NBC_01810]WSA25826.1 ATP-binding protein [Streptosporangium sp. NBC_01810]
MEPETFSEILLPSNAEAASIAREEVRKWLGESHPAYENARLAVSELVTNAVQHARHGIAGQAEISGAGASNVRASNVRAANSGAADNDPLVLRLMSYGGLLRVEVADTGLSTEEPHARADPACLLIENGRGLAIVGMLSGGNWGYRSHGGNWGYRSHGRNPGRTVWCELPAEPSADEGLTETSAPPPPDDLLPGTPAFVQPR